MKLTEFAAKKPDNKSCKICILPSALRKEVEEGQAAGITYNDIAQWLAQTHNIPGMRDYKVYGHFLRRHHETKETR